MKKKILTGVLAIVLPCLVAAQSNSFTAAAKPEEAGISSDRLARIDLMLDEYVKKEWVPGVVALIIRDGKIVYHKSFGSRDISTKTPLKKDDIFRIASMSKAITSLAVMMLYEEGKFLLDDPLSKYIPEFKSPKILKTFESRDSSFTTSPANGEITIRQLLTHTSGLDYPAIGNNEFKSIYAKAGIPSGIGNEKPRLAERMKILGGLPLKHEPGEKWTYGLNSDVLGYLVEVLSGMSFDQFLRTRIFEPLGMNDTYFYLPREKQSRLVTLHENKTEKATVVKSRIYDNADPNYPNTAGQYYSGGAGLSSTAEDYAKFLQMFLNNGVFNGKRLLSRKTIELMMTDQVTDEVSPNNEIGLGFGLETSKNDRGSVLSVGSFSWGGAFNTHYWADPKERLIGILYTNLYNTPHWNIGERFKTLTYQSIAD